MRYAIVTSLESLCGLLDRIPIAYRYEGRWRIGSGCIGCHRFRLAELSSRLDERWETGVWS